MRDWLTEFKLFVLRRDLLDVAIGIVIGIAFAALVGALVADLVTPLIGAIGGKPDFGNLAFTVNDSKFKYGDFLNNLITFAIISAVVFFLIVKPVDALLARAQQGDEPAAEPTPEVALLTEIRDLLKTRG